MTFVLMHYSTGGKAQLMLHFSLHASKEFIG
jgi:hypothetical protein